jgi:tetratricopeptide (TPR) repeat protein
MDKEDDNLETIDMDDGSADSEEGPVSEDSTQDADPGFLGKVITGIGAVVAGVFAVKKLAPKKHKNYSFEGQQRINPVLEEIRDKRGMELFIARKEEGSINIHIVTPNPADYFGGWKEMDDSDEKRLFFRGVGKQGEYHYGEALDIFAGLLSRGALGVDNVALLIMAGNTYYSQSMFSEAEKFYQKALGEASAIKDDEGEAIATGNLCITYLHKNLCDKARRAGEDALKKYRQLGKKEHEADTLSNLALIYRKNGEPEKAMRTQEDALKVHRELEDSFHTAEDLGNLGLIYQQKNDVDSALKFYDESLELHKEIRNKKGEADQLGNIGGAYQIKGDLVSAQKYEEEALQIHRALGNMDGEANQLGNIGLVYQQRGESDKALAYFGDALRLHRETGNRMGEATGMVNIGIIYRKTGELEKAIEYQRGALKIFSALGARKQMEVCQANIIKIQDMMVIKRVDR